MRLPRDLSGDELIRAVGCFGYIQTRQTGSHIRVTTRQNGEHHVTIPLHSPLRVGTLSGILHDVAEHFQISRDDVLKKVAE